MLALLLIGSASALYAGECQELDVSELNSLDNIVYTVVGNSSDLEGLDISINQSIVNICPVVNYKPDNFTLIFWDNTTHETEKEVIVYRGGGSSRKKIVYENVTEYVEVEKLVYVDKIIEPECEECQEEIIKEEKIGFFKRVWNWIKNIFKKNE